MNSATSGSCMRDVGRQIVERQQDFGLQRGGNFQRHRHRLLVHDVHRHLIAMPAS